MKFTLQIFVSDYKKAVPFHFIKREQEKYPTPYKIQLKWDSWTFQSEKNYGTYIDKIPILFLEVPDDTLFSTFEDICKDVSEQLDCLVYGESYSFHGQPGCGFHGCYDKGKYVGFCPLRDEVKQAQDKLHYSQFYHILQITSIQDDYEV